MIYFQKMQTPVGTLHIACSDKELRVVATDTNLKSLIKEFPTLIEKEHPILTKTTLQLQEYFQKKRKTFDLPLGLYGTNFQNLVWNALLKISYAKTISYADQAKMINREKAVRAVANANGKNPISIIVPCHRVISKDGSLGGYTGGVEIKKFLLELESKI